MMSDKEEPNRATPLAVVLVGETTASGWRGTIKSKEPKKS